MLAAGINGVRINMSHGTADEKADDIARARAAADRMQRPLSVLVDLSGPKIRTRTLKNHQPVKLTANQRFAITTRDVEGDETQVATNYAGMPNDVHPGDRILLDDGAIELRVESTSETDVVVRVINGGVLGERKGINLPGISLPIPSMTAKDRDDVKWAAQQNVDYFALSFVRSGKDCSEAKELIRSVGSKAPLIAKIEKAEAIDHLDEVIAAADGVAAVGAAAATGQEGEHRDVAGRRRAEHDPRRRWRRHDARPQGHRVREGRRGAGPLVGD